MIDIASNSRNKKNAEIKIARSVCPHDCPSTCALDVEVIDGKKIGRVRGAKDDPYTAGVICEKVARYAERIHHPDRLLYPMRRVGAKGQGKWEQISWDEALDEIAKRFNEIEAKFGSQSILPYYYAGTMGHVMRDGIHRLRHAKNYSRQYGTICSLIGWGGYTVGTGLLAGVNPVNMAKSDCVIIWGTNAVNTQINLMTHAMRAKKQCCAKIVVIDIYRTATMEQADLALIIRPGTDGALAVAVMHVLLRDGLADYEYMAKYTDFSPEFESHLKNKTPQWAAKITGLSVAEIEEFAHLIGKTKKSFFRLGYGFTRQRNGYTNMHAALCIPAMSGAWQYEGGGAFHTNGGIWSLDKNLIEGASLASEKTRNLDMSELGPILTGDKKALKNTVPIKAMLVQNTNPAVVNPEQEKVIQGLKRDDLFLVVHEQFMSETAELADIVLPATMFLEHDDFYTRSGHSRVLYGKKIIDAPAEAKSNLFVINELAKKLGVFDAKYFGKTAKQMALETFAKSGGDKLEQIEQNGFIEYEDESKINPFESGFAWSDKKFRFAPNWQDLMELKNLELNFDLSKMPKFADHFDVLENTDETHPFRLATSPARSYLNSSFNETPTSQKREGEPKLLIHPKDAKALNVQNGDEIQIGNKRGQVILKAHYFNGIQSGTLIAESLHPNKAHKGGQGINTLIGSDPVPPFGGAAFHDCAVWVRAV
jgi:anaerobic selenocysteine-containing dehydrogenase